MSPIGRIFSVINLALAALFLGWASVNLAASQEYKAKFEAEQAAKSALEQRLTGEISQLRTELATKSDAMDQVSVERDNLRRDSDRLAGELTDQRNVNSQLRTSLDTLANTQSALQDQLATQTQLASQSQAARSEAEQARDNALRAQQQAESARADVVARNEALGKKISDLEKELNSSASMVASLNVQLEQLQVLTGASLSDILPQKRINGTVVQALYDVPPGLVAINRGSKDGVVRGYTFEISSGTQYKGQVRVENVREDMCTCVILRTEKGQTIRQGDRADTVL